MKKYFALLIVTPTLLLSSCGLINYEKISSSKRETANDEMFSKKSEYLNKLDELYNEDNYDETEKSLFISCLVETKAQIQECKTFEELKCVFDVFCDKIDSIKTKEQYKNELMLRIDEYIAKIEDISTESIYRDGEKEIYNFYINEAVKAFNSITNVSEDFEKIYLAYKDIILTIKTDDDYLTEEANAFEAYKNDAIKEVEQYIDLNNYREAEVLNIKSELLTASDNILKADNCDKVDSLVREYKTKVYQFETDEELYAKELDDLIDSSIDEISNYLNILSYRNNEAEIINTFTNKFIDEVEGLDTKEKVADLISSYKKVLNSIKTDSQLYEEEKLALTNALFFQLKTIVNYNDLSNQDKQYYDCFYETLVNLSTKEEVESIFNDEKYREYKIMAISGDAEALVQYQLYLIDNLKYYLDKSQYREAQQHQIDAIINASYSYILSCLSYNDTIDAINSVKDSLNNVLTNDEMWEQEDLDFCNTLNMLYGNDVLMPEGSLTEASNYYELARIIDYYAFYQVDANSFIRDTFRVKMSWCTDSANSIISKMKNLYCELAKYAVDLTCYFEGDYLVVRLIPYDFGSELSYPNEEVVLHNCLVSYFNSEDLSPKYGRNNDFNDFNYLQYQRSVNVWNSQQLWYALEHDYCPICDPGSRAEEVLNYVKSVLRIIIKDGMNEHEKIFNIFTWIANNIHYSYNHPDDRAHAISYYPEGALEESLLVCGGFAKLYLIMLRAEGIKAFLTFRNGSSHESLLINIEDLMYFSDVTFGTYCSDYIAYSYLLCLNIFDCVLYNDCVFASECSSIYHHLLIDDQPVYVCSDKEFSNLIDYFVSTNGANDSLNVLYEGFELDLSLIPDTCNYHRVSHYFGNDIGINEIVLTRAKA